jgi:uncharacterized protein (DUF2461 family)
MLLNSTFNGFPREMPEFLSILHFENTLTKQAGNLQQYKKLVTEPLIKLYEVFLPTVFDISTQFETKPSRCISSPYTDRRFSPDKPLKEYMYIRFKQIGKAEDIVGLYFDIGADCYSYGLRIYKQTSKVMERLRKKMAENPEPYLCQLKKITASGFSVFGEKYKKDHYPSLSDNLVKDILNRKRFYIGKNVPVGEKVFTSDLADEITDGFLKVKNFLNLLEE